MSEFGILGIHEKAVGIREKRAEIIASNLANEVTPNFKARDLDFRQALASFSPNQKPLQPQATQAGHAYQMLEMTGMEGLKYRTPVQPSVDGNTVDASLEKAAYSENMLRFIASHTFLDGRIKGIKGALKGD